MIKIHKRISNRLTCCGFFNFFFFFFFTATLQRKKLAGIFIISDSKNFNSLGRKATGSFWTKDFKGRWPSGGSSEKPKTFVISKPKYAFAVWVFYGFWCPYLYYLPLQMTLCLDGIDCPPADVRLEGESEPSQLQDLCHPAPPCKGGLCVGIEGPRGMMEGAHSECHSDPYSLHTYPKYQPHVLKTSLSAKALLFLMLLFPAIILGSETHVQCPQYIIRLG